MTLERPSEAFDLYSEAFCEAFEAVSFAAPDAFAAVSFAASEALAVVDSNRRAVLPVNLDDCRSTARDAANGIMSIYDQETEEKLSSGCPDVGGRAIGR